MSPKIEPIPERPSAELTIVEIAERAVDRAFSNLQCAMVELEGARQRLEMVKAHEHWKKAKEEIAT